MTRPLIGVTAHPRTVETATGPTLLHTVSRYYVDSVARAGGLPVLLPVVGPETVGDLVTAVDGLLLTGGGDIAPSRYGAQPVPETSGVDPGRDAFEIALVEEAVARDLPLLAICRGMQLLNVVLGGSLVQHLPAVTEHAHDLTQRWAEGVHPVRIDPDSHLAEALGVVAVEVNSIHHQAVERPAPGARAVAWAPDGTVEALEIPDSPHVVAVQWHPELLEDWPEQQGLFGQLVAAARVGAERRGRPVSPASTSRVVARDAQG